MYANLTNYYDFNFILTNFAKTLVSTKNLYIGL